MFRSKAVVTLDEDGMSEIGREIRRNAERRDRAMAIVHGMIAERTGIEAELIPYLPPEYLTIAVLLGVKVN